MTEPDWLLGSDAPRMLDHLTAFHSPSVRKLRLFAVACAYRVLRLTRTPRARQALGLAERHADGRAGDGELARFARGRPGPGIADMACVGTCHRQADELAAVPDYAARAVATLGNNRAWNRNLRVPGDKLPASEYDADRWPERAAVIERRAARAARKAADGEHEAQAALLREVFGNPFRSADFLAEWRTPTVVALARAAYEGRVFDRLPVLADALEDAGCDDVRVLQHCRDEGHHSRGCWVLDLCLGRE